MKKTRLKRQVQTDELRPEYDLKKLLKGAVRGKYAARYHRKSNRKINRQSFSIVTSFDDIDVTRYWHSQTPQARLRYMEELRRMNYGDLATQRLSRVLEVAKRAKS